MTFYSVRLNPPPYACSGIMPKPFYFTTHKKAINFCKKNQIDPLKISYYDLPTKFIQELHAKIERTQEKINDLRSRHDL